MKFLIFLPMLIGIGGSYLCPYELRGRVVNSDRNPVEGVRVYHSRTGFVVTTNDRGEFKIPGAKAFDTVEAGNHPKELVMALANERGWLQIEMNP